MDEFVFLTCGQNITISTFVEIRTLLIFCEILSGVNITAAEVYKDGEFLNNIFAVLVSPFTVKVFGTYTFVLSTGGCGHAYAVSTVLPKGQFLCIHNLP